MFFQIFSKIELKFKNLYKQIKGNFYYGIFGEFQLVDKTTGCFNATKLCNIGGKKFKNWTVLSKSKQIIEYFDKSRGHNDVLGLK